MDLQADALRAAICEFRSGCGGDGGGGRQLALVDEHTSARTLQDLAGAPWNKPVPALAGKPCGKQHVWLGRLAEGAAGAARSVLDELSAILPPGEGDTGSDRKASAGSGGEAGGGGGGGGGRERSGVALLLRLTDVVDRLGSARLVPAVGGAIGAACQVAYQMCKVPREDHASPSTQTFQAAM
eukprot:351641-Chlamydomonas_euryale.AAC.7